MIKNVELLAKLVQSIKDKNSMNEKNNFPPLDYTLTFDNTINDNDVLIVLSHFDRHQKLDPSHYLINSALQMYSLFFKVDFKQSVEIKLSHKVSGAPIQEAPSEEKTPEVVVTEDSPVEEPKAEEVVEPVVEETVSEETTDAKETVETPAEEAIPETPAIEETKEEKKAPAKKKSNKKKED